VTAALLAATAYVLARITGLDMWPSAILAATLGLGLRAGALIWGWSLPGFAGGWVRR